MLNRAVLTRGGSGSGGYRSNTTCLPVVEPGKPFADAVVADTELKKQSNMKRFKSQHGKNQPNAESKSAV
jgi:hypothetical protein